MAFQPVVEPEPVRNLASTLMLVLGVVGALMVILSPCAIELTTYYTGIIAGVVSSAAIAERGSVSRSASEDPKTLRGTDPRSGKRIPPEVRGRILRNLTAFVLGFTVLYMASGATVALMGQQLMSLQTTFSKNGKFQDPFCAPEEPASAAAVPLAHANAKAAHANHGPGFGEWTQYSYWLGAGFLIYFALKSVGVLKLGGRCFVWLAKVGRKFRAGYRRRGRARCPRASIIRSPSASMRQPANIRPSTLSVRDLACP